MKAKIKFIEECECCESYHEIKYTGDCRNDSERFPPDFCENIKHSSMPDHIHK